ncbi:MAG: TolC family outer membrane protein [Rhizobiaceae bacterium]
MSSFTRISFRLAATKTAIYAGLVFGLCATPTMAVAETINSALASAYANNPTLNAQRAATRGVDENVAIAKSGWRPQIFGNAKITRQNISTRVPSFGSGTSTPGSFGVTISQSLWDSNKTLNNVNAARAAVKASRESLRNTEQNVLIDSATSYMDVIRDQAIAGYRAQSLKFLNEQVRSERARFEVGESTRTDVAQAEASRAAAVAQLNGSRANLKSSKANFRRFVGRDPKNLKNTRGLNKSLPRTLGSAMAIALSQHPAIKSTQHLVDQAAFNVKSSESSLLPTITLDGVLDRTDAGNGTGQITDTAQITATLRIPIYQGGRASGLVRQNKEALGQSRIQVDSSVDQVRAAVVSSFGQLEASRASVIANQTQLRAARLALSGVVEERKVGQRTTLDVLNTQQNVITAQISLASDRHDVVVAGYALMSAIGRLSASNLRLQVALYEPEDHYFAVKDKWFGLRTPDQR